MTTNEYRLGGAGGYSLHALGWKNQNSVVYERIELRWDLNGSVRVLDDVSWQNTLPTLFDILQAASVDSSDRAFLTSLYNEARKHLAMGVTQ
jgi:hypothetical protein